jgi:hypothetical protein
MAKVNHRVIVSTRDAEFDPEPELPVVESARINPMLAFHAHLDSCEKCAKSPYCADGLALLPEPVASLPKKSKRGGSTWSPDNDHPWKAGINSWQKSK